MIGKFLTTVNVRDEPSTDGRVAFKKYEGNIVNIINRFVNEDRIWISFEEDGSEYYCCEIDSDGSIYIKVSEKSQSFNETEVNMKQKESSYEAVQNEGCCFLCACYLGGLNNIEEADECFEWATKKGKVRSSDSYVLIDKYKLANDIAELYGRNKREGEIIKGKNHFYVVNNGIEVFNSIRPGYGNI